MYARVLLAGLLVLLSTIMSTSQQRHSSANKKEGLLVQTNPVRTAEARSENMYPVYRPEGGNERHQTAGVDDESRNYQSADSPRSYSKSQLTYNGYKKMDEGEMETSTRTISSYEADRGPVYRQQYHQAEPPPYPPLADTASGEISAEKSNTGSQADMSYLPQPDDYAYYSAAKPALGDSPSYQAPESSSGDLMASSNKPETATKGVAMVKIPHYPGFHHHGDFLPTKPPDMKLPDKDYDYIPFNAEEEQHYLPYNPEMGGNMFGHSSQQTGSSEENDHGADDLHYQPPTKTKPKGSGEAHNHDAEDDDFSFHFPKFHAKKPSAQEGPSGGKMKHNFHMYSSSEEEGDDDKPTKGKSNPPPPEVYFSGPHKPLHNYDSYLDHEPEDHKHEDDDDKFHHEHEDHNSDFRLNKKPYSYYYLGRKLWYIPLYFSVYFIIYVTALILKSIARHKIRYPITHWTSRSLSDSNPHIENISANVTKALSPDGKLFMR